MWMHMERASDPVNVESQLCSLPTANESRMKAWSLHLALSANQSDIPRKALMLIFMISLKQTYFIRLMSGLPRFSHGSDFSKLASSEQEEQTDYVVGILAVSFFIISLFIFWAALIIACKCMGKRRVGLCAGRMRFECDEKGQFYPPSYAWKLRFTFVVLGCCMFLLCLTLAGPGLVKVMTTSESVRKLSRDVNDLTTQGLVILDSLERVKRNIDGSDVLSIPRMEEACPKSNIIVSIDADFDHVNEYIQKSYLERIRQHIDFIIDETEHIEKAVTTFEENDWIVKMFALFLGGLIIFMIFAAFYEWSGSCQYLFALTCMLELFILPTFVLAIACCWVATSALAFASIFNSGNLQQSGPAGTLMQMFEERGITSDHMVFTAFAYYQSGCVTEDPIIQLYKYEDYIQSGIGLADQFLTKANGVGIDEINEFCGADVTPFIERIGLIKVSLELLLGALRSLVELASCSKMSALYKLVFEELACTDARVTFELLFLIMFAISLLGMVLVMLRAGMYPLKIVFPSSSLDEEKNELEEYRAYLQYVSSFINSWGGNMDNDVSLSPTVITSETSSESTSSSVNLELGNSPTIISPSGPVPRSFHKAQVLDCTSMCENKEIIPLSPPESRFTFDESRIMYAPDAIETSRGDSSEYTPLTPHTSSAHSSDKRRFTTPDSPSVVSAIRQQAWVNCFSNFVSPSRIGNHCGDKSE